jgi:hypothetical protein
MRRDTAEDKMYEEGKGPFRLLVFGRFLRRSKTISNTTWLRF